MMNELQTCPFCGNAGGYFINIFKHRKDLVVGCSRKKCFCRFTIHVGINTKQEKIDKILSEMLNRWNKRNKEENK